MTPSSPFDANEVAEALAKRFEISRELGVGGQGVVYKARRLSWQDGTIAGDEVALKVHLDSAQDERAEREIRMMAAVHSPYLARLLEHGAIMVGGKRVTVVAWEYIDGAPLNHRITSGGALQPKIVASVGRDVCLAITEIWNRRVVHRDINPKNVMLRAGDREAVLIDLGAARHIAEATLTAAGLTWGTMGYLSPEQARAETSLTCASDIFALAVTLQEALCGRHPTGGDQGLLISRPVLTADIAPSAPAKLASLIDSMLALRAAFRPNPPFLADRFSHLLGQL